MAIGTFHIPKGKAKVGKAGEVIDVAARYFVYKLYEDTDGQPAQWRALHAEFQAFLRNRLPVSTFSRPTAVAEDRLQAASSDTEKARAF